MPTCRCCRVLARQDGLLEQVLSTEPAEFKLNSFLSKIGRSPVGQLQLTAAPESAVDTVYPLQESTFSGSLAAWVGRYQAAKENVAFTVHGVRDGAALEMSAKTRLPSQDLEPRAAAAIVGSGSRRRLAGEDSTGRRRSGHHRRNHPPGAAVQVCDALHVVSGGAASLAAASRDSSWRSRTAGEDG